MFLRFSDHRFDHTKLFFLVIIHYTITREDTVSKRLLNVKLRSYHFLNLEHDTEPSENRQVINQVKIN